MEFINIWIMYGKLNERKLKETDYILSCQATRKQLDNYMDSQNKRVNIDSAKKLAVMQHMDYEGFRQMVLGANIFPTKSKELYYFSKGQQANVLIPNKLFDQKKQSIRIETDNPVQGNSEKYCFNFRDFKKKFMKNYIKELAWQNAAQCYQLLKQQDKNRLQKIFNIECEADLLVKIVEIFRYVIEYLNQKEKFDLLKMQVGFMVTFLQIILKIETMQEINLNILTKKQKEKLSLFFTEGKNILQDESVLENIKLLKL